MGRQFHFYMLDDDLKDFLRAVQTNEGVVVTVRDSESPEILPIKVDQSVGNTLCIWDSTLLSKLERKWIPEPGYYRLDSLNLPMLELMPSFKATWEGKPAIGLGRLFGNFEAYLGKPQDFEKWYEGLVSWIRRHYRKSPTSFGGFVGPAAHAFYERGGFLLPNFLPPRTDKWLAEIGRQHLGVNVEANGTRKREKKP